MAEVEMRNNTRQRSPRISFNKIKDHILGDRYDLSLVFIGDRLSKKLNMKHRGKSYTANILTFPLTDSSGEIFINLRQAEKEAHKFELGKTDFVKLLFIHGCLHLKGLAHGDTMERQEQSLLRKF